MFRLDEFLPYRLFRLSEIAGRGLQHVYKDRAGLTRPEWRVLATLGEKGELTATELGAQTGMHKTKISRAIAGLGARRWVVRARRENDRRFEDISLTKNGHAAYRDLVAQAQAYNLAILQTATNEEQETIENGLKTLEKIMKRV